ncbi:MAG: ribosome biogenesis GTPase Der [Alphaproteobacteria bacterium]|nr:ribosome biogenesis GTPase Der [Alphaproteobacteria bacterium]
MALALAIVGRPNVGKSTLFNRLAGRRLALVDDRPGVTRDRREGEGKIGPLRLKLIDTAGLEESFDDSLSGRMRRQTDTAVAEADAVLFLIDARAGVTPLDRAFAVWLRKQGKPVILAANKCEGAAGVPGLGEAHGLGLGEPVALSAAHGEGMAELYDRLAPLAEDGAAERHEGRPLHLAIIGQPNVGKSTLVNRLLGADRVVTGPEPGLTRDAVAIDWSFKGRAIRLFDTAGLRKKAAIRETLEKLAAADALRAVRYAEAVVVLLDATSPVEHQDLGLIDLVAREGRALTIGLNKWDLVEDRRAALKRISERIAASAPQVAGVELVAFSAETGEKLERLMPAVLRAEERWNRRVPTAALNRWLEAAQERQSPPMAEGRRIRFRYAAQVKARPPTFALFANKPGELPGHYMRYLANSLRAAFDLPGVPLRLGLRKGKNPYVEG